MLLNQQRNSQRYEPISRYKYNTSRLTLALTPTPCSAAMTEVTQWAQDFIEWHPPLTKVVCVMVQHNTQYNLVAFMVVPTRDAH